MTTAAGALAAATASLVVRHDVVGTMSAMVEDCAEVIGAQAAGLMIADGEGPLEVLVSSPRAARDLEMYELQAGEGPCLDAFSSGVAVQVVGSDELLRRWPVFGRQLVDSGLRSVCACPLRWRGVTIGALNAFLETPDGLSEDQQVVLQAFADVATIAVVHAGMPDLPDLGALTHAALEARTVVEQAKGVLAFQREVSMDQAYDLLLHQACEWGDPLEDTARSIIDSAVRGRSR
ncbi:GAF and ANTAR domain-containing protein [Angustibacter sp. McL0619]|uniref:GAF and ANTAR domain-containing protein n=1 Tax=Angustibacter sp. McL0619 TaxID=3415676 RepID=UPI003CE83E75